MVERTDVPWVIDLFDVYRFLALRSYDSRCDKIEENFLSALFSLLTSYCAQQCNGENLSIEVLLNQEKYSKGDLTLNNNSALK